MAAGEGIRAALLQDAGAILEIYRPYVEQTTVTFEYETPSVAAFQDRMRAVLGSYPYLIYLSGNEIVGYAYASRQREREAYQWNAELSVYLRQDVQRRGMGSALYRALIALLRLQGIVNVYSIIAHPNEPSERFHRKMGFSVCGISRQSGWKFGRWIDACEMQLRIAQPVGKPQPVRPFCALDPVVVGQILDRAVLNPAADGAAE